MHRIHFFNCGKGLICISGRMLVCSSPIGTTITGRALLLRVHLCVLSLARYEMYVLFGNHAWHLLNRIFTEAFLLGSWSIWPLWFPRSHRILWLYISSTAWIILVAYRWFDWALISKLVFIFGWTFKASCIQVLNLLNWFILYFVHLILLIYMTIINLLMLPVVRASITLVVLDWWIDHRVFVWWVINLFSTRALWIVLHR